MKLIRIMVQKPGLTEASSNTRNFLVQLAKFLGNADESNYCLWKICGDKTHYVCLLKEEKS